MCGSEPNKFYSSRGTATETAGSGKACRPSCTNASKLSDILPREGFRPWPNRSKDEAMASESRLLLRLCSSIVSIGEGKSRPECEAHRNRPAKEGAGPLLRSFVKNWPP